MRRHYLLIAFIPVIICAVVFAHKSIMQTGESARSVTASMKVVQLTEESGNRLVYLTIVFDNNQMPDIRETPTFEIMDANNKQIVAGSFTPGCGGVCSYTWSVPAKLKGPFIARITSLKAPYKTLRLQDARFTL